MQEIQTNKCTHLFERIVELEKEYINFWIDVCKIESPTEYKEGVDRVGRYFACASLSGALDITRKGRPVNMQDPMELDVEHCYEESEGDHSWEW